MSEWNRWMKWEAPIGTDLPNVTQWMNSKDRTDYPDPNCFYTVYPTSLFWLCLVFIILFLIFPYVWVLLSLETNARVPLILSTIYGNESFICIHPFSDVRPKHRLMPECKLEKKWPLFCNNVITRFDTVFKYLKGAYREDRDKFYFVARGTGLGARTSRYS